MNISSRIPNVYSFLIVLRATDYMQLPPYKGSLIRGLIGTALRHRYCQRPYNTECSDCDRKFNCVHAFLLMGIFNPLHQQEKYTGFTNHPQPYTIEAPHSRSEILKQDDKLQFSLNLLEPAIDSLLIWLQALQDISYLTADKKSRGKLVLDIIVNVPSGIIIYSDKKYVNAQVAKRELIKELPAKCYLKLLTPLRLKTDGKPISENITAEILCRRMIERVNQLNRCYGDGKVIDYPKTPFFEIINQNIYWTDIPHRSNRQNIKLKMGGVKGNFEINICNSVYSPLIHFTTIFGLGSYVTAGFGKMELQF